MPPRFIPLALVADIDVVPNRLVHVRPVPIPGEDFQRFCVFPVSGDLEIVILFENIQLEILFLRNVQATFIPQKFVV